MEDAGDMSNAEAIRPGGGRRVLIADSDGDFAGTQACFLGSRGYAVCTAQSLEEARAKGPEFGAQVALFDIRLGESDGLELIPVLTEIRPETVFVVVTACAEIGSIIRAFHMGAHDYLRKPVEWDELLDALDRAFERIRLGREGMGAAGALEARNRELEQINARLRRIVESTKEVAASSSYDRLAPLLLTEFAQNMAANGGSLFLLEGDELALAHSLDADHVPVSIPLPLPEGSVFARAMGQGRPILIEDISIEPELAGSGWDGYRDGSLLVFPLPDEGGRTVGFISLHNKSLPPFVAQDRDLGAILASFSSETIRAMRAREELRRIEAAVDDANDAILITDHHGKAVYANAAFSAMFGHDTLSMDEAGLGTLYADAETAEAVLETVRSGRDWAGETTMVAADGHTFPALLHASSVLGEGAWSMGALFICSDISERKRAEEQFRLYAERLEALNAELELSNRERARMMERLAEMSVTDELTALANRRYLDRKLEEEISRSQRTQQPFVLLMIDIDHFKAVNDQHGHQVGDETLKRCARAMAESLRRTDFIARYGGEEFCVVLPETPLEAGNPVAEKLRLAAKALPTPSVTVSIGAAQWEPGASATDILQQADKALYAAKEAGRDCVVAFGEQ
jgi:diguanylate cyclase (GGDEF)-like protein/PAS domain S-box-containing protein